MTNLQIIKNAIAGTSDPKLEDLYREALKVMKQPGAGLVIEVIENEYAKRHGWEALEALLDSIPPAQAA